MAAAGRLSRGGLRVLVLEARDRIGGRIATDRSLGWPVDLGAAWVHGGTGNPLATLARRQGLKTFASDFDSLLLADPAGATIPDSALDGLDRAYEALTDAIARDRRPGLSVAQAIAAHAPAAAADPLMRWALASNTEFDTGAPLHQLSAELFAAEEAFAGPDLLLPQGFDRLLPPLAAGLDIRFGQTVRHVRWAGQGVEVRTDRGRFTARAAICCLPLGVLQAGSIDFSPALPAPCTAALSRLGSGGTTKAVAVFERPFWQEDVQFFGRIADPAGRWCYALNHLPAGGGPALTFFAFGDQSGPAEALDERAARAEIAIALHQMFGARATPPVALLRSRWIADPFSRGTYAFPLPGARAEDFDRLAAPLGNRLFLAGEHVGFDHHGTAHGALLSGRRAAAAALRALP